jgi:UDP:flavonoid glycosyltransferase YjiC (YdhE family)
MTTPPTIVFQPFATAWLGHTSRLIAIAQAVRRRQPEARLPFLTEGNSGPLLEHAGFPHFALPHRTEFAGPQWGCWSGEQREAILYDLGKCILDHLQPQVVVFDSPACPYLVDHVRRMKVSTVLCARKTRTATRTFEWAQTVFTQVDLILVPHEIGAVPVPQELAARTHFVGPMVRLSSNGDHTPSVKSNSPLIVITGGGGGYPGTVDFYNLALSAFRLARSTVPALEGILVTGDRKSVV